MFPVAYNSNIRVTIQTDAVHEFRVRFRVFRNDFVFFYEMNQQAFHRHNKGKYQKHDFAFRGLLTCAHDNCTMTPEKKKGKYIYYRCSGYRGKCDTPWFREEEISEKLGEVVKAIHIPDEVMARIQNALTLDQERSHKDIDTQRSRLEQRLVNTRRKMDQAYDDKLSGTISENFWQRKMEDWRNEEQQIEMALDGLKNSRIRRIIYTLRRIRANRPNC
jgi:site-specific DNA recombinase